MAMGRGGAGPKDGVFIPAPHGFVLPYPRMMGKIFLSHPHPLRPRKTGPTPSCKTLLFVNLSTTITIVFN